MKKKNTKAMITRILACVLLVATLGLSLASCAAKDKAKDAAGKVWDTAKDGAEKIYDAAKDKIAMEQVSGMAAIKLLSAEETVTTPTYAGTLTASDFAGNWTNTNGKGALYVQSKECVGTITSVTGATMGDYWSAEAGEKPVVAIDGNNSKLSVLLPTGYNDVAAWAAAAADFSITVTPVMEKTLQATVLPESATDKSVTWSVSATEEGVDASEYIRLLTFDGAAENKISVLALQPFGGHEFIIKCTTVVGGFTAECKVTYEGVPSYLGFHQVLADGGYRFVNDQPTLITGTTYTFKLAVDNVFHSVGDKFGNYEIVKCYATGSYVGEVWTSGLGNTGEQKTIDASTLGSLLFGAKIEGDTVSLYDLVSVMDYTYPLSAGAGVRYKSGAENVVYHVDIRDTVSGVVNTLSFQVKSSVTSVSLSESNLVF